MINHLRAVLRATFTGWGRRRAARDRYAIAQIGDVMIQRVNAEADAIRDYNEAADLAWYQPPLDPRAHERRDTRGRGAVGARVNVTEAQLAHADADEVTGVLAGLAGWAAR